MGSSLFFYVCCSFVFRKVRDVAAERINRGQINYGGGVGLRERRQQKNEGCSFCLFFFLAPSPIVFPPVWPRFLAKHVLKICQNNCLLRRLTVMPIV